MKTVTFSVRLNKADYDALKLHATIHKKPMNKIIVELVSGCHCLCPHHDFATGNTSRQNISEEMITELHKTLCITRNIAFEALSLLRLNTEQSYPDLIERAEKIRKSRYPVIEDGPDARIRQDDKDGER